VRGSTSFFARDQVRLLPELSRTTERVLHEKRHYFQNTDIYMHLDATELRTLLFTPEYFEVTSFYIKIFQNIPICLHPINTLEIIFIVK
jgi:hypothetical protein